MTKKSECTTIYLGNTRTVSDNDVYKYCSKFGLILDCSRRLKSPDQLHLVDFTFVRFFNAQSSAQFLSISSHTLENGIILDVRSFDDVLHTAVPLHVDRKICICNVPGDISMSELKKYLRTFGTVKHVSVETNEHEERNVFIEFDSLATRNKLLRGKIKCHRLRDHVLNILPFLRPTDVNLHHGEEEHQQQQTDSLDDPSLLIHLERDYNLKIREQFHSIEHELVEYLRETRHNYDRIVQLLK